jgi:hypothetical protein
LRCNTKGADAKAHHIAFATNEGKEFMYVVDLGLDRIHQYQWNDEDGTLTPLDPPFFQFEAGTGPRHMAFAPESGFARCSVSTVDSAVLGLALLGFARCSVSIMDSAVLGLALLGLHGARFRTRIFSRMLLDHTIARVEASIRAI